MSSESGNGNGGGGAFGALFFVIGILILFALLFGAFLIVPFFIFLAGIVAMIVSDRKRDRKKSDEEKDRDLERQQDADEIDRENAKQGALI